MVKIRVPEEVPEKLNAMVAVRFMGAKRAAYSYATPIAGFDGWAYTMCAIWEEGGVETAIPLANYGGDIHIAWMVANKIKDSTGTFSLSWDEFLKAWEVTYKYEDHVYDGGSSEKWTTAKTAPMAICKAALLLNGVSQEEIDEAIGDNKR